MTQLIPVHQSSYRTHFDGYVEGGQYHLALHVLEKHHLSARPSDARPAFVEHIRRSANIDPAQRALFVPDVDEAGNVVADWFRIVPRRLPNIWDAPDRARKQLELALIQEDGAQVIAIVRRWSVSITADDVALWPEFMQRPELAREDIRDHFSWLSSSDGEPIEKGK